ncbi:hypothetical protein LguiB_030586 [Lonicera macranthoides]
MASAPPSNRLQAMLQTAVQSVQWTYSLFWQLCPQQGMLVWGDGYYNGAIKTRKTVQPVEVSTEEASLQRSQQLRELYDTLSAGETNQPARRPSAALSPEDLTESEWFYLMCVSFSFPPGVGLPGKAYAKRQHVWLAGANEVDSKLFTRAILAKVHNTVVCIPLLDGVVELGTTERILEDHRLIQQVKSIFVDHSVTQPPKPALSEQSTSNPGKSSSDIVRFHSPTLMVDKAVAAEPPIPTNQIDKEEEEEVDDDEEDEEEDDEDDADHSDSEAETETENRGGIGRSAEPSELMQVDMSEDIRLGSPDDGSNHLDSDFHLLAVSQIGNPVNPQQRADSYGAELTHRWPILHDPLINNLLPSSSGVPQLEELTQEDTHYSHTVSTILHRQSRQSSSTPSIIYSPHSSFTTWPTTTTLHHHHTFSVDTTSQYLLKYILFSVPYLHSQICLKSRDASSATDQAVRFRKGTPQDDLSANHMLAERRRREKLNERFIILRSLVPFVTKMDKASILGDTIEYVKQLRKKIQDLEARTGQLEQLDHPRTRSGGGGDPQRSGVTNMSDKRKMRIVEGSGRAKPKAVELVPVPVPVPAPPPPPPPSANVDDGGQVEVSIIECDALVELQCKYREGLLLDVMQKLRELRVEITTAQSSLNNGIFVGELRAKVKENVSGKKVSIMEVKRAMNQIIPQ